LCAAGIDIFTFHVEVKSLGEDLAPFIALIKSKGVKAGLAVKPGYLKLFNSTDSIKHN
jgi:pentose-5-phosphate-3-epimerase